MGGYDERPWLARYDEGQPSDIEPEFTDALAMFRASADRNPDGDILRYFDGRITLRELDELSDAFAAGLLDAGFSAGERVALYLQNVPQFVIALVGTWKAGGIAVNINPMNRAAARLGRHGAGVPAGPVPRRRGVGGRRRRRHHGDHHVGAGVPDA
jgi:long-chain acyl-CoA synthetase